MEPLAIKEIQKVSLDIMSIVHDFCVQHEIRYSLMYGTLIGAIRHQGFIPWDDDIDIIMPRPDYDRFCNIFNHLELGLICEKDKHSFINYCRVFDTVRTRCTTVSPFARHYRGGVWIDIFPIDGVSDDFNQFATGISSMKPLWIKQLRYRQSTSSIGTFVRTCLRDLPGIDKWKSIGILSTIKLSGLSPILLRRTNHVLRSYARTIPFGATSHWSQLTCLDDGTRNYQLMEDFTSLSLTSFEDKHFYILNGYDRVLRNIYGDYRALPPENQRINHHTTTSFFWS